MKKKVIFLILSMVLWASALWASPLPQEPKAIAFSEAPRSTGGNAQTSNSGEARPPSLQRRNPRYQLCKSDVFDLDFPFTPEFNQTAVTVQPDGYVTLRGVGDLHVEGLTVPEATQALRTAYAKILHDPVITIALKDFNKPYFIASGQVAHPGKFDLRGDTTVTQGLAIAGGITDTAKHSQVLLFRRVSSDWYEVKTINVKRLMLAKDLNEDLHLQPGDLLFVPTSTIAKVKRFVPSYGLGVYYNPVY
jgi:polysaccharide export outer membrane protein